MAKYLAAWNATWKISISISTEKFITNLSRELLSDEPSGVLFRVAVFIESQALDMAVRGNSERLRCTGDIFDPHHSGCKHYKVQMHSAQKHQRKPNLNPKQKKDDPSRSDNRNQSLAHRNVKSAALLTYLVKIVQVIPQVERKLFQNHEKENTRVNRFLFCLLIFRTKSAPPPAPYKPTKIATPYPLRRAHGSMHSGHLENTIVNAIDVNDAGCLILEWA